MKIDFCLLIFTAMSYMHPVVNLGFEMLFAFGVLIIFSVFELYILQKL